MTALIIPATRNVVFDALNLVDFAPETNATVGGGLLYAPSGSPLQAALIEAWSKIRAIVETSARRGWAAVEEEVRLFGAYVKQTVVELGGQAKEFVDFVLDKIRETVVKIFDTLLRFLRTDFLVDGSVYKLESVELEHKILFSVEVETNLLALCKLAGEGELTVKGAYRLVAAPVTPVLTTAPHG